MRYGVIFVLMILGARQALAQKLVAETPPLSPNEQLSKFHLPPGFEIQLVAHEPAIHKPMNLSFDAHGSLWVTNSVEYPFPATSEAEARDAISILSEISANGKAQKVRNFANHLNIPIGIVPLTDQEALAWSIPHIFRLTDTNSDGLADEKTIAFGPFDVHDTHGNQNAFTRWVDGWIYANHGFYNDSHVKIGGIGDEVLHMQSGNTYRFLPDGTAIEQFSWGQVNPFGLSFDPLGNLYSADCHSRAVTMLLREGYYQSFGKPHDGLGFAPETTTIDHGGTGIAGVVYSTFPDFPPEYRDVLFVGNVITNRVHCDRLKWTGSTPEVDQIEDFITCDDPWFRPVDLQQGPDGALYIADFYNCIIGHYEVPLTHPDRDRERGRIWRVVYTGEVPSTGSQDSASPMPDLESLNPQLLFEMLGHPNLTVRVLATNYLVDRYPDEAATMSHNLLEAESSDTLNNQVRLNSSVDQISHAIWLLQRTVEISEPVARSLLSSSAPANVQVHAVKALGETAEWQPWHFKVVRKQLSADNPFIRRAAAESLAKHPAIGNLLPLLDSLQVADPQDAQLYHQIRIAVRDQLRDSSVADQLLTLTLSPMQRKQLVEYAATAPQGPSALLIFDEALQGNVSDEVLVKSLPAAAKYVDAPRVDAMIEEIHGRFPGNSTRQMSLLQALAEGLSERGLPLTDLLDSTLTELIRSSLSSDLDTEWRNLPLPTQPDAIGSWVPQQRISSDGDSMPLMISSLSEGGERMGGILRSPAFQLPEQLSFWMCGHNGLPGEPDRKLNFARLVLEDGTEVARSYPPRNDVAEQFDWIMPSYAGKLGHIEIVDGMTDLDAYAWIAVSRFEPAVVSVPDQPVKEASAMFADLYRLVGELELTDLLPEITAAANSTNSDLRTRLGATKALLMLLPAKAINPLNIILADASLPTPAREEAAQLLGSIDQPLARTTLITQLKSAPESVAVIIATGLAGKQESATALLNEIREGRASAMLLREPTVVDRLRSSGLAEVEEQIEQLTEDLSPMDNRITQLLADRRKGFLAGNFDAEVGRAVFAKSVCANCHRIGQVGSTIGPALDGIGSRGLDRLLEDTLDPNRNVDVAFRTELIETEAGQILSGFGLRQEGQMFVLNDANGKQIRVPQAEVLERHQSALSPMPTNVIEQMPEKDYFALLEYLLSQRSQ